MDGGGPAGEPRRNADRTASRTRSTGRHNSTARAIQIVRAPREHVGLGVGTQLSLAIALAVLELNGETEPGAERLARLTGRGYRSGIGLHGFRHGGLIVDGGRKRESDIPPMVARVPFPEDWSVLIVQPPGPSGLHGPEEIRAFAHLASIAPELTDQLCRLVLLGILPAVIEHDLTAFGAALCELQTHMGDRFAPAQGGPYTAPAATTIVAELKDLGFVGVGQSSWGPTLYAFSDRPDAELVDSTDRLRGRFGLDTSSLFWTKASSNGARILEAD